ncbi:ccaat-binding factor-related [Schistosoma mansoni]|uniref:ccaat-binding factor-related n=1 Tax=Schistosoma mansoni TaxID=6183 RepID=UPI00022DC6EB|nr:ccaat-binding factor-related [Schistosoma mansoni]|eukprot:XP_018651515.1 ccaat-binding factor-related [Schistosoma mansoni]
MALKSKSGQDYMCAMAYLVNSYPLYAIRFLDNLISFVSPSKKRDCFKSLDILSHLFCSLIPKNRALITVTNRPLNVLEKLDTSSKENVLCLWHFEDELKAVYLRFIKASEKLLLSDCVDNFKRKALGILGSLVQKQENQTLILNIIINKLGDRSKEFASAVIHKLRLIAGISSSFLHSIVQEVRSFLFRPNLLERSKYYAISLLSCLELKSSSRGSGIDANISSVASTLIKIYMSFFRSLANSKEIPERLTTILLSGLCRVAPFISEEAFTSMLSEVNDLFRLVHTTGFTVSVQALSVLFQISTHCVAIRDRYYQALYRKLLDPAIHQSSKNPILLRLIYQSMAGDDDTDRIVAFIHRILQLCISHTDPGFIVGCLILINKVSLSKPNLIMVSQINKEHDAHCSDDDNCNGESVQNGVMTNKTTQSDKSTITTDKGNELLTSSWYHRSLKKQRNTQNIFNYGYNPTVRDPKFAQATGCLVWPLSLLSKHIHPTINLFANSLLNNLPIQYTGDPFTDFGLMHFLDRFAYKKPKLNKLKETKSITEEHIQKTAPGKLLQRKEGTLSGPYAMAVDSSAFRQLPLTSVPVHERFFHNYFKFLETQPGHIKKTEKKTRGHDSDENESDTDSVADSEFDAYLGDKKAVLTHHLIYGTRLLNNSEEMQIFLHFMFAFKAVGAEEVGHLYDVQETAKEKRQRFWEQKRLHSQSSNSSSSNHKRHRYREKEKGVPKRKRSENYHHGSSNQGKMKPKSQNRSKRPRHHS